MKKIFNRHMTSWLIALAIVFSGFIIAYFVWSIGFIFLAASKVTNPPSLTGETTGFNLQGAASLNYRGALSSSTEPIAEPLGK